MYTGSPLPMSRQVGCPFRSAKLALNSPLRTSPTSPASRAVCTAVGKSTKLAGSSWINARLIGFNGFEDACAPGTPVRIWSPSPSVGERRT